MNVKNLFSEAIQSITALLDRRYQSNNAVIKKSAVTLAYWIKDYVRLLWKEGTSSKAYRKYDRGSIISVHLGFRIGHEEGGLHYAIVLEKFDVPQNPVITVMPLTSVKSDNDERQKFYKNIYLGSEINDAIYAKLSRLTGELSQEMSIYSAEWSRLIAANDRDAEKIGECEKKLKELGQRNLLAMSQLAKVAKMKSGSIALANQIITVSKLRIYDPLSSDDLLYGVKLSVEAMDKVDEKLKYLYLH